MNSTGPWVEAIEAVEGGCGAVRDDRVVAEVEQPGHQLLLPGRRCAGDPQDVMTQPFDASGSDAPVHLIAGETSAQRLFDGGAAVLSGRDEGEALIRSHAGSVSA